MLSPLTSGNSHSVLLCLGSMTWDGIVISRLEYLRAHFWGSRPEFRRLYRVGHEVQVLTESTGSDKAAVDISLAKRLPTFALGARIEPLWFGWKGMRF